MIDSNRTAELSAQETNTGKVQSRGGMGVRFWKKINGGWKLV